MISMDGASLFSSLFAKQSISARVAPAEAAEGDRDRSDDDRRHIRAATRQSARHRLAGELAVYDRAGATTKTAAALDQGATAAALEYRRSERTTLQIRTQEGDVVRLKFRAKDALSAQSATVENGETTLAELSVRARSTTRLKISVQGDLNADELTAIQNIVDQAGALANEFYSGGTAEAAALASSLDLNPEQLDQVRLRFSLRERLTYTQIGASPVTQPTPAASTDSAAISDAVSPPTTTPASTTPTSTETSAPVETDAPAVTSTNEPVPTDVEPADAATAGSTPLFVDILSAFDAIAAFLTDLLDALSAIPDPSEASEAPDESNSVALRYEMSFKLRVFQSILVSVSEASGEDQDETLPPIIDEALDDLAAQQEPGLDAVA